MPTVKQEARTHAACKQTLHHWQWNNRHSSSFSLTCCHLSLTVVPPHSLFEHFLSALHGSLFSWNHFSPITVEQGGSKKSSVTHCCLIGTLCLFVRSTPKTKFSTTLCAGLELHFLYLRLIQCMALSFLWKVPFRWFCLFRPLITNHRLYGF